MRLSAICLALALCLACEARAAASTPEDLKNPFTRIDAPPVVSPPSDLHDPFDNFRLNLDERADAANSSSLGELRNPFAERRARDTDSNVPAPAVRPTSVDGLDGLKNPFRRPRATRKQPVDEPTSDLKNPFARRPPPSRSPATATRRHVPATRSAAPLQRPRRVSPAPAAPR